MTVMTEQAGEGIRVIALNRPERLNAINGTLLTDLTTALHDAHGDESVRAIVLTGEGRAFCSGDDLKEFDTGSVHQTRAYVERIQEVTRLILLGNTPVIGAIRGWAVGGGLEWVLNCDFAVCAESTQFFFPEVSLGVFVTGGATSLLPRLVGLQKARELMLFGDVFDASQARDWGLVWKVVPDRDLLESALEVARRVAALPHERVHDLRRALVVDAARGLEAAMAAETEATIRGLRDPRSAERALEFASGRGAPRDDADPAS
jgi:enoyl-CoA hydratase/carnithine racemase